MRRPRCESADNGKIVPDSGRNCLRIRDFRLAFRPTARPRAAFASSKMSLALGRLSNPAMHPWLRSRRSSLHQSFVPPVQPAFPKVLARRLIDGMDHCSSILLRRDRRSTESSRPSLPDIAALAVAYLLVACIASRPTDDHLIGTVFNQVGGFIAGAAVTMKDESTGATWSVATDDHGVYRFDNLSVDCRRTASAEGFETALVTHIAVALNRTWTDSFKLQVGDFEIAATVTAESAQIDTTTTTIGNAFNSRQSHRALSTKLALCVLNLSLRRGGVTSSGTTGLGQGPSIASQRHRPAA